MEWRRGRVLRGLPLILALGLGCSPPAQHGPSEDAVALVNGVPITEADLALALSAPGHGEQPVDEARRQRVLDTLVTRELRAQAAVDQGLDRDPAYLEQIAPLEAELRATRRKLLGDAWLEKAVAEEATVGAAEVDAYIAAHRSEILTERHIWQILARDPAAIRAAHDAIAAGEPFEAVAAEQFSRLPEGGRPWDLGFLKWSQLPPAWATALADLAPGGTSAVIEGPGGRFWVIRLVEERPVDPSALDGFRPVIEELVRAKKAHAVREERDRALRERAAVER